MSNLDLQTLLAAAYGGQGGSGGGGGIGTSNYNDLSNRPKINGVTLSGDKTPEDLGIPTMTEGEKEKLGKVKETDTELSETSENNIQNKVVTGALKAVQEAVGGISDELDKKVDAETGKGLSTNDYDNTAKGIVDGITAKVEAKQDKLTFDTTPTASSKNPVESGGIKTALDAKAAQSEVNALANAGAKNLLKNGADSVTKTYNGVTATLNSDGSLTINGTATSDFYYYFVKDFVLKAGKYILSNGKAGNSNVMLQMNGEATASVVATDAEVTLETDATVNIFARVRSGGTANNITFYPMLRSASITDDTYVPYGMSNAELTEEIKGRALNGSSEYVQFSQDAAISKANVSGKGIQDGIDLVGRDTDGKQWLARLHHAEKQIALMHTDGSTWTTDATFTADEDTGWQTLASGVYYRKKNGMVTISMSNNSQAQTATETAVATLPEGCRPSRQIIAVGVTNQFAQYLGISVNTNGEIRTRTATDTGTGFYGSVSFPV